MRLRREKRIKYAAQLLRIKPWPAIFDRDDNCIATSNPCFYVQHSISIPNGIHGLNCVLDQIGKDLLQLYPVASNKR